MTSSDRHWYAAYVRSCQERNLSEKLTRLGVENYVPVQKRRRQWSDRVKIVDVLVIPRVIFVRCTEGVRRQVIKTFPDQFRFISDKGPYTPSVIPDEQMETFRRMVEYGTEKVKVLSEPLEKGDLVEIVNGPLKGRKCRLMKVGDKSCVGVNLGSFAAAAIEIPLSDVKKIDKNEQSDI